MKLLFYTPICDLVGLAQRKNEKKIIMHIAVFPYVSYTIGLKYYIILSIYGQLYKLLVSKLCMQYYIVTMTMNIINMFIQFDKNVATTWSPMYSECIQLSVYSNDHVYFVYCIDVEVH